MPGLMRTVQVLKSADTSGIAAAAIAIGAQTATYPNLVFLRDKALLFDDDRGAFIMYGVQGRTWVALGDPVGSPDRASTLIRPGSQSMTRSIRRETQPIWGSSRMAISQMLAWVN